MTRPTTSPQIDTQEAQYYDIAECPKVLESIRNHLDPEWQCIFTLSFYCGTHPEELVGLNWSDLEEGNISITAGAYQRKREKNKRTEKPKTNKSNRIISLPEEALSSLDNWRKVQAEEFLKRGGIWADRDTVFTNDKGERLSIYRPSKAWKAFTTKNNLRHLPLYDLRHTNCSLLISSKELSVEEVAARMGHEQTSTTLNIYSHAFNNSNKRATAALMNVLDGAEKCTIEKK